MKYKYVRIRRYRTAQHGQNQPQEPQDEGEHAEKNTPNRLRLQKALKEI